MSAHDDSSFAPRYIIRTKHKDGSVTTSEVYTFRGWLNNKILGFFAILLVVGLAAPFASTVMLLCYCLDKGDENYVDFLNWTINRLALLILTLIVSFYILIDVYNKWIASILISFFYRGDDLYGYVIYLNGCVILTCGCLINSGRRLYKKAEGIRSVFFMYVLSLLIVSYVMAYFILHNKIGKFETAQSSIEVTNSDSNQNNVQSSTNYLSEKKLDTLKKGVSGDGNWVLDKHLQGNWQLNGSAKDESGNENNGIVYGAVLAADRNGNKNAAYHFNGTPSSYILIPSKQSLQPTYTISLSAWINIDASCKNNFASIITKLNSKPDNYSSYQLITGNAGQDSLGYVGFTTRTNLAYRWTGHCGQSILNKWEFVAATWDGKLMRYYQNGVFVCSTPQTGLIDYDEGNVIIGKDFKGFIDDVSIWSGVLSDDDILNLYKGQQIDTSIGKRNLNLTSNDGEVVIGTQIWTNHNLNVNTFRNGDVITQATTPNEWKTAGEEQRPAWCYYNFDANNESKYGKLYNWYAATDSKGLAPYGWHIPSNAEWITMVNFIGGEDSAGIKMKRNGFWPKTRNVRGCGFSAVPAGACRPDGSFYGIDENVFIWSSTPFSEYDEPSSSAYCKTVIDMDIYLYTDKNSKSYGYSCRCIKN